MLKELAITTTTYEVLGGFRVDIVCNRADEHTCYEAWLYYKNYGVKELMFGSADKDVSFREFCDLVEGNLGNYIGGYYNDYMVE